jgi:hypothetical protein
MYREFCTVYHAEQQMHNNNTHPPTHPHPHTHTHIYIYIYVMFYMSSFAPVQTGPGAHPASCTMGTGSLPGVKRPGRGADQPPPSSAEVKKG